VSPHNWVGPEEVRGHHTSVRLELLQLMLDEVAYRSIKGAGSGPATWAAVVAEMLADHEMFGWPPIHLEATTPHGNAVLKRWRLMHTNNLYRKARKAVS
jgi:hypothetical protein